MFTQPETWVAIAFVILMGVFAGLGVHRTVLTALDHRAQRIKAELDDARRLKDEAAKLLADYQARSARAERAAQVVDGARPPRPAHQGRTRRRPPPEGRGRKTARRLSGAPRQRRA